MGNSSKINSYNHSSNGGMTSNDIMNFISNNNLLRVHSDLGGILRCSPEVNVYFLNFFKVLRLRGENFDEKNVITSILKKPGYSNERDLLTYLNNLIKFSSIKTIDGKYFIPPKYVKILADFKNYKNNGFSDEKINGIIDVLDAIQLGWLPSKDLDFSRFFNFYYDKGSSVTDCFMNCSSINPFLLYDIRNVKKIKNNWHDLKPSDCLDYYIPEYDNEIDFRKKGLINSLPVGSLVSFKNSVSGKKNVVFVVSNTTPRVLHGPLHISRNDLIHFLPPIQRFFIKQSQSGTCYQLAGYISMMQDPYYYSKVYECLYKNGNSFSVALPCNLTKNNLFLGKTKDFNGSNQLFVNLNEKGRFDFLNKSQTVTAKPLFQALEFLYGKYRKYYYADKYLRSKNLSGKKFDEALNNMIKNIDKYVFDEHDNKWKTLDEVGKIRGKKYACVEDYYKEGGWPFEMFDMFGDGVSYNLEKGKGVTLSRIKTLLSNSKIGYAKCFVTDKYCKSCPEKGLVSYHVYSILDYDPKTDIVKYINPWNSAFVFEIKLPDLLKYITNISIKKNYS